MAKSKGSMERKGMKTAKRESASAPPDTTKPKGKNSPDSKGPGPKGFMSKRSLKMPKGCGK